MLIEQIFELGGPRPPGRMCTPITIGGHKSVNPLITIEANFFINSLIR